MTLALGSCKIDNPEPIPITNVNYGAILRTIKVNSGTFNKFDLAGSKFSVEVEVDDPQRGKAFQEVDVFLKHRRGQAVTNEIKLKTIPESAFAVNETSKLPRTVIEVTANEAMAALQLTEAQVDGGDFFEFRMVLRLKDGRTFTDANASEAIRGTAFFNSPFFYRVTVVCPSDLAGTASYETTNIVSGPGGTVAACGGTKRGNVTITAVAGTPGAYTISDVSFGLFECLYGDDTPPGGSVRLNDACLRLSFTGSDRYGDRYTITPGTVSVSADRKSLTFDWKNTYGDGGRTTLTRTDNKLWPAGLR